MVLEIEARTLTPAYALRVLLAHDQRQQDGRDEQARPAVRPLDVPQDLWRMLTADAAEMGMRRGERARDQDQVRHCAERLAAGKRLSADALHVLGGIVEEGVGVRAPPGPGVFTAIIKGVPQIAPNVVYSVNDALALIALTVLVLYADVGARGTLARCKECGGLFLRPAARRGHRRRMFCPDTRCGPRYHERAHRRRRKN